MEFTVEEHGGIDPENCNRVFFLKHFAPYIFAKKYISGKKVLEIGSGSGYGSYYLSIDAKEVVSVDP